MPQLLSRRDDSGWLTPSMADILKQSTAALPAEDRVREQVAELQQSLAELETPARIVDIRPSPSHILFIARPELIGRWNNRRLVTPAEIRRSLGTIAERHPDWTLGFLPKVQDDSESVGILLRTEQNQPLRLRPLLISNVFLQQPSTLALPLGVTVEQQPVIRDLPSLGHFLVVGADSARRHVIREILLTLFMLNTPSEVRLALVGSSAKAYEEWINVPHTLGRLVSTPEQGLRLFEGMVKEAERRRQWFMEREVNTLQDYNSLMQRQGEPLLPRVLILFDSLSDGEWQETRDQWTPQVYDLLVNGARVGIHMILTANQHPSPDVPELLDGVLETRIVMRSANPELAENLKNFHSSALRFVDAFILRGGEITPIELCAVGDDELERLVVYWRQIAAQRAQEARPRQRTGLTDLLPPLPETDPSLRPAPPMPTRTRVGTLARATQALSASAETENRILGQAQALAAYLGWIGLGPLRDVLGLSTGEARTLIAALQNMGVVEEGEAPVLRFVRLAENPLTDEDGQP